MLKGKCVEPGACHPQYPNFAPALLWGGLPRLVLEFPKMDGNSLFRWGSQIAMELHVLTIMLVLEKVSVCMQLPSDSSFTLLMSIGSGGMDLQNSDNNESIPQFPTKRE